MTDAADGMGPVGYLIVEFPAHRVTGEGMAALLDLVDRGLIRVLDLTFVRKEGDVVTVAELNNLDRDGTFDVSVFEGASSGLLDSGDVQEAGKAMANDATAAILLYENVWATPFVSALRRNGAQLVAAGFIPLDALAASLDAA
jgi:hypothetical protein